MVVILMPRPEVELHRKVTDFVKKRIKLTFVLHHKVGSSWKKSNLNARWSTKAKYRYVAYVNRRNRRYIWPHLSFEFQTNSIIQLYRGSNYRTKTNKQIFYVKNLNTNSLREIGRLYFKAKRRASKKKDALGGLYQGIPAIPSPLIPWAIPKKARTWLKN